MIVYVYCIIRCCCARLKNTRQYLPQSCYPVLLYLNKANTASFFQLSSSDALVLKCDMQLFYHNWEMNLQFTCRR